MSARDLGRDMGRLIGRDPGYSRGLGPASPAREVAPARGVALATGQQASGGGAFEESDASLREYWPVRTITSSDGLFTFEAEPIKSITMVDGSKALFAQPKAAGGEGDDGEGT